MSQSGKIMNIKLGSIYNHKKESEVVKKIELMNEAGDTSMESAEQLFIKESAIFERLMKAGSSDLFKSQDNFHHKEALLDNKYQH